MVELVVLGKLLEDLGAVVRDKELVELAEPVHILFLLDGVDGNFVEHDTFLEKKEASVHEVVGRLAELISLLGKVSQLPAGVHDEDNDFLFVGEPLPCPL